MNIPNTNARAALLSLSDDPRATRLDLIEWKQPRAEGKPYRHLYHTGIARVALFTKNLDEEYPRLKAATQSEQFPRSASKSSASSASLFLIRDISFWTRILRSLSASTDGSISERYRNCCARKGSAV